LTVKNQVRKELLPYLKLNIGNDAGGALAEANCNLAFKSAAAVVVLGLILFQVSPSVFAQTSIAFTSADRFLIPSRNGIIGFATNGTYANARLENDTWYFTDLQLNSSQPLRMFNISVENSNVTIFAHLSFDYLRKLSVLAYFVEGQGKQAVNIGIEPRESEGGLNAEWSVLFNDVFMGEGDGWSIARDGTITVTGAVGNVTIIFYSIEDGNNADLTFFEQHSIVLLTGVAVAVTITAVVLVKVKNKKQSEQGEGRLFPIYISISRRWAWN
jgi:hypothetical protein